MPKAWSSKDERKYEHIKESSRKRGRSTKRAKEIAARTVNKQRKQQGRTKSKTSKTSKTGSRTRSRTQTRSSRSSRAGRSSGGGISSQTKEQLYQRAKRLNIPGRSTMSKGELLRAIRRRS